MFKEFLANILKLLQCGIYILVYNALIYLPVPNNLSTLIVNSLPAIIETPKTKEIKVVTKEEDVEDYELHLGI